MQKYGRADNNAKKKIAVFIRNYKIVNFFQVVYHLSQCLFSKLSSKTQEVQSVANEIPNCFRNLQLKWPKKA